MADIRILCGTFHLRIDGRTGGVEKEDLLALIWKYCTSLLRTGKAGLRGREKEHTGLRGGQSGNGVGGRRG